MTFDLAQAEELAKVVQKTGVVFGVTHNYTGYPLVRQAREMVQAGELGEINAVRAFYIQGWLRTRLERGGAQKQAELAHRPEEVRRRRLLRRHRHARLQPRPLHHRPDSRADLVSLSRRSSQAARSTTTARPSSASRTARSAPSPRRRSRTAARTTCGSRSTARRALAGMASGRAEQDDRPHRRQAAPDLHARPQRRLPDADGQGDRCRLPSGHPEAFLEAFANVYTAAYDDMAQAGRRPEVRRRAQPLSQRRRRRRRHELHHAMRRQRVERRAMAVAETCGTADVAAWSGIKNKNRMQHSSAAQEQTCRSIFSSRTIRSLPVVPRKCSPTSGPP